MPSPLSATTTSSAELLGQRDDDVLGAADVTESIGVPVVRQPAGESGPVRLQASEDLPTIPTVANPQKLIGGEPAGSARQRAFPADVGPMRFRALAPAKAPITVPAIFRIQQGGGLAARTNDVLTMQAGHGPLPSTADETGRNV